MYRRQKKFSNFGWVGNFGPEKVHLEDLSFHPPCIFLIPKKSNFTSQNFDKWKSKFSDIDQNFGSCPPKFF
jgi:hypothetical protein